MNERRFVGWNNKRSVEWPAEVDCVSWVINYWRCVLKNMMNDACSKGESMARTCSSYCMIVMTKQDNNQDKESFLVVDNEGKGWQLAMLRWGLHDGRYGVEFLQQFVWSSCCPWRRFWGIMNGKWWWCEEWKHVWLMIEKEVFKASASTRRRHNDKGTGGGHDDNIVDSGWVVGKTRYCVRMCRWRLSNVGFNGWQIWCSVTLQVK